MSFLAICCSLLRLVRFFVSYCYQKAKIGLWMSLWNKKMTNYIKGRYKITCYKTNSNFSLFFFSHWLLHNCFFSFLIKAFENFEKLIWLHWHAFVVYKNGENFKILIKIFFQKLLVYNVVLAFLDQLKPRIFSIDQPWWPT